MFTGQLFGIGMMHSLAELTITDVVNRLHTGQIVQQETSGVGMYAKASVFSGSVGPV